MREKKWEWGSETWDDTKEETLSSKWWCGRVDKRFRMYPTGFMPLVSPFSLVLSSIPLFILLRYKKKCIGFND